MNKQPHAFRYSGRRNHNETDNLIKHEVDLADMESDENVKNFVQLLDAKLEDMSKKNRILKNVNSAQ